MTPRNDFELDVRRTLNFAAGRRTTATKRKQWGWPDSGLITRYQGISVFRASGHPGYGFSTHARGYLTHVAGAVYTAWHRGRVVGALVKWKCGGSSALFQLSGEAAGTLCPLCLAAVARAGHGSVVLTTVGPIGGPR